MKPLPLTTKRLILRRSRTNDAENLFHNYCSDIECSRFLTRKPHTDIQQTSQFLSQWCDANWDTESDRFAWVVSLADTQEAIGVFLVFLDGHKAEIHYGVGHSFWHQGFATELVQRAIQWLTHQPELKSIWTVCDLSNVGSFKILEKLGFIREGILRKQLILPAFNESARDCYIYSHTWN